MLMTFLDDVITLRTLSDNIQSFQKRLWLMSNKVARPKGTMVTLFDVQSFICCVHFV